MTGAPRRVGDEIHEEDGAVIEHLLVVLERGWGDVPQGVS